MSPYRDEIETYKKLHRGFLLLQRRMRSLRTQIDFPLDSISAIIVLWIGFKPVLHFGELQRYLRIPKATLSRLMQSLVDKGYLRASVTASDTRKKQYEYTEEGLQLLAQLDTVNNRLVRLGTYPLTPDQRASVIEAVRALATGLGAPPAAGHPGEEPLFTEIRRISRVSGMVGSNYLGSGHDIMLYHIFSELGLRGRLVPLKFFTKTLRIPPSSLSREISKFVSRGWIEKLHSRRDRKLVLLRLTEKGRQHYEECEEMMATRYQEALRGTPLETVREWIAAFAPLEGLEPPALHDGPIAAERCESDAALHEARVFVVEELLRSNQRPKKPEAIIPTDHDCIAIREAGKLLALVLAPRGQEAAQPALFSSAILSSEVATPEHAKALLAKAAECVSGKGTTLQIEKISSKYPKVGALASARPKTPRKAAPEPPKPLA